MPHVAGLGSAGLFNSAPAARAQQDQQLPVVTAAKPVVREIVEDDEFVGRFEAVDEVAIRSRVSGYLDKIHFKDGAIVNKGDLLFTIDQRPYQAAYDAAKSQVDVANSLLEFAKAQLDARRRARQDPATSPVADRSMTAGANIWRAQAQMQGATAALSAPPASTWNSPRSRRRSPGRIDRRLVSVGNLVQPDPTLLTTIVALRPDRLLFRRR